MCIFYSLPGISCFYHISGWRMNKFAQRRFPVHIPPQAARGAVWPWYQMAKAMLPVPRTLQILLPHPLAACESKGVWHLSLASRPLTFFTHPIPPDHPAWSSISRWVSCCLFPAEGCVFCLSFQSCWEGGSQGSRTLLPDIWRGSSVQKKPVFTHYGPSNPVSTAACFDYLKAKNCSRKPVRYVFLDRGLIWEYFLRFYLLLPLYFLDQCPLPGWIQAQYLPLYAKL